MGSLKVANRGPQSIEAEMPELRRCFEQSFGRSLE
jgi:hypothetical protein